MKVSSRDNSTGMALIMVMIAIAVFSSMAGLLWMSMKVETQLARNAENEQQLLWLGRSGVEYARWILSQHPPAEPYDSLMQIWAGGPGGPSETNSPLAGISMDNFKIGDGTVSLKIVDLERFANINTAPPALLQQALTVMGANADDISVVSDSIQDWRSPPTAPRVAGAESDYYQSLTPPYNAKNAPLDDISELLLVKGVTPQMYDPKIYGDSSPNSPAPQHPKLGFGVAPGQTPDYPFGLKDVFTAVSSGKINVNTADVNVLQLLPGMDTNSASAIIQQRAGPDGVDGTEDDTPFRNASEALKFAGPAAAQAANLVTVGSSTWRVNVTAQFGDEKREFTAILYRGTGSDIQVVGFYWK
jgi:general secretion pathway protein K